MLRVIEWFDSIQGEGVYIGTPMSFVRLAGCNLRCKWCDTQYAFGPGREVDEEVIVKSLKHFNVCITGGEPLLQDISRLVDLLHYDYRKVHIETNGTIVPEELPDADVWTISPKLSNSGMRDKWSIKTLATLVDKIRDQRSELQLKFVIVDPRDMLEALDVLEQLEYELHESLHFADVVFQPEGSCLHLSTKSYSKVLGTSLYNYILKLKMMTKMIEVHSERFSAYNVRILPQLHVMIWGKERGR